MQKEDHEEGGGILSILKKGASEALGAVGLDVDFVEQGSETAHASHASAQEPAAPAALTIHASQSAAVTLGDTSSTASLATINPERVEKFRAAFRKAIETVSGPYNTYLSAMDSIRNYVSGEENLHRAGLEILKGQNQLDIGAVKNSLSQSLQLLDQTRQGQMQSHEKKVQDEVGSAENQLEVVLKDIATLEEQIAALKEKQIALAADATSKRQDLDQRRVDLLEAGNQMEDELKKASETINRIFP